MVKKKDPAQVLPVELMGEIFTYSASMDWKAPLGLSRVCRNWTKILNNTPRAWAFLQINQWIGPHEESLHTWLSRAHNCPLRFRYIRQRNLRIVRMCSNIRSLHYDGHASDLNDLELPTLKHLSLTNYSMHYVQHHRPPPADLRNLSHSLAALHLVEYYQVDELKGKLPDSITELHLHPRDGIYSHQLLESIHLTLSTLCIHTDSYFQSTVDSQGSIVLPNLRKLVIRWGHAFGHSDRMVRFVNNIHTPRLQILHEIGAGTCTLRAQRNYEIRSTVTEYITENPDEEGSFLKELDNVEILRIACKICSPTRVFPVPQCNVLSKLADNPHACPKLKELELFVGTETRMIALKVRIEQDVIKIAHRDPPPRMHSTLMFRNERWANLGLFSAHINHCFDSHAA